MDDTTQTQQTVADAAMSNMNDVAGMTPPPAPVMPAEQAAPAAMPAADSAPAVPGGAPAEGEEYSYAEDVLNEILDSLDRIEAKLEAMEKKMA